MSKAFTSEETEDTSIPGRVPVRALPGEERPITVEGHRALVVTRARLEEERRDAEDDDMQKTLDHHVALVTATLDSVRVMEPAPPDGTVRFGSFVEIEWLEQSRRERLRVVGPDEVGLSPDQVSITSPLGRALLGHQLGDAIEIHRPRGAAEIRITRVS